MLERDNQIICSAMEWVPVEKVYSGRVVLVGDAAHASSPTRLWTNLGGAFLQASLPTTLANMRANGVRSLSVNCWLCHHGAVLAVYRWPGNVPVPSFGPRMVCTGCGHAAIDELPDGARPSVS